MKTIAVLMAAVLAASSALAAARLRVQERVAAPPAEAVHPATGQELFVSSGCIHCHMIDGAGGNKGPNLNGAGRHWKDDELRARIVQSSLEMPPYEDVLSETEIQALVSYLHTHRARDPKMPAKPAKSTPAD